MKYLSGCRLNTRSFHCALWGWKVYTQTRKVNGRLGAIIVSAERRKLQSTLRRMLMRGLLSPQLPPGAAGATEGKRQKWAENGEGREKSPRRLLDPGEPGHLPHAAKQLLLPYPPSWSQKGYFLEKWNGILRFRIPGYQAQQRKLASNGMGAGMRHELLSSHHFNLLPFGCIALIFFKFR